MSESDTSTIETRIPVIGPEGRHAFLSDDIDKQWGLITEATRRNFIIKPESRNALLKFCTTPVSETLPDQFLKTVSGVDERIARLAKRYRASIRSYLEIPPVPDEQVKPDIRNAPSLRRPDDVIDMLNRLYSKDDPMYEESLKHYIGSGAFLRGITEEERLMITKRYKYARDVKLLVLGAEIINQGNVMPNEKGEVILPSGIKMVIELGNDGQRSDLLKPHLWVKRRQLKDRVHEIDVNGKKYILKEKKTARHTDTKRHGHREGRLSSEEFEIARYFQEHGTVSKKGISVIWERPVGYVSYPDGFSFAVFEYEEGLVEERKITLQLAMEIIKHKSQFEEEYQLIKQLAEKYKDSPEVLAFETQRTESGLRGALTRRFGLRKDIPLRLSFEEFAMVKASRMERQARELMQETITINGYNNSDIDGYSYRIKNGDRVQLEIVGFDFEYFSKMSPEETAKRIEGDREFQKEWEHRNGIGFLCWNDGSSVTRMQKAAYFAMLETEGVLNKGSL